MCCCEKPVINGEMGYRWQPDHTPSIRAVDPPSLSDGEVLVYDEPGRCGGQDSHSYHYRVVRLHGSLDLLVKHGAGIERVRLSNGKTLLYGLELLDGARYWTLNALYHAYANGKRNAQETESYRWRQAAAEKRIKTRKQRNGNTVKVWIEDDSVI